MVRLPLCHWQINPPPRSHWIRQTIFLNLEVILHYDWLNDISGEHVLTVFSLYINMQSPGDSVLRPISLRVVLTALPQPLFEIWNLSLRACRGWKEITTHKFVGNCFLSFLCRCHTVVNKDDYCTVNNKIFQQCLITSALLTDTMEWYILTRNMSTCLFAFYVIHKTRTDDMCCGVQAALAAIIGWVTAWLTAGSCLAIIVRVLCTSLTIQRVCNGFR